MAIYEIKIKGLNLENEQVKKILKWADENNISELDINRMGIPRNEMELLNLEELDLSAICLKVYKIGLSDFY